MSADNMLLRHVIRCHRSGLQIGTLEVCINAGALPYLSHWHENTAYHPLFSLSTGKLLKFMRDEWDRLGKRAVDAEISEEEANLLSVGFLAILHTLECVKQDCPALPPLHIVQSSINKLFGLAYWKWKLESERFRFPTYHLNKINDNLQLQNIGAYLDLCYDVKRQYEEDVQEALEAAKVRAANKALVMLNNTWVTPPSKKILWQWVKANLPAKYQPDAEGWLSTIFLGGPNAITSFDEDEIKMAEEIIVSECPAGTGIMFAVRERLKEIQRIWATKYAAFQIELEDFAPTAKLYVNGVPVAAPDPGPAPKESDFPKRTGWIIANAKWSIAHRAWTKQQEKK